MGPPPEIAEPIKENALNLPDVDVEEGVVVVLCPDEEAEVDVSVKAEVIPAVSPCQSSSSSEVRWKEEGCDMVDEEGEVSKLIVVYCSSNMPMTHRLCHEPKKGWSTAIALLQNTK